MPLKIHNLLSTNTMHLDKKAALLLTQQKKTLALAESCTGGLLAHTLTNLPGASQFLYLGIIAYDNSAKVKLLGVSPSLIKKHGAVSPEVAQQMANNVRKLLKTDLGIAITGIAGPTGGTTVKPVGLVYIALADKDNAAAHEYRFKGSRLSIKNQSVKTALTQLIKKLS